MRGLEAVDKIIETGVSGMIIGEILCLFAYIACLILLLPLEWWSQTQINESGKGKNQGWDRPSHQYEGSEISEGG